MSLYLHERMLLHKSLSVSGNLFLWFLSWCTNTISFSQKVGYRQALLTWFGMQVLFFLKGIVWHRLLFVRMYNVLQNVYSINDSPPYFICLLKTNKLLYKSEFNSAPDKEYFLMTDLYKSHLKSAAIIAIVLWFYFIFLVSIIKSMKMHV